VLFWAAMKNSKRLIFPAASLGGLTVQFLYYIFSFLRLERYNMKNVQFLKGRIYFKVVLDIESRVISLLTHFVDDGIGLLKASLS
jgi:hypothetical protein